VGKSSTTKLKKIGTTRVDIACAIDSRRSFRRISISKNVKPLTGSAWRIDVVGGDTGEIKMAGVSN
jgi:hypothetical protein